jgi:SAM-dependent methyltransferase
MVGDVAGPQGLDPALGRFDGIVCQLLLSVVGDPSDRRQALVNAHGALVPGGSLFASLSGRSDDINPEYARSYREDFAETREDGTYFSRDEQGNVLYRTHHFRQDEVLALMEAAGFSGIDIQERIESSSRRPEQKARFLYATAVKA